MANDENGLIFPTQAVEERLDTPDYITERFAARERVIHESDPSRLKFLNGTACQSAVITLA